MIKKNLRKFLSLFIAIILISQNISYVLAVDSPQNPNNITIFHTNDMHGRFKKDDKVLGLDVIKSIKNNTPNSILVDAGDTIHGLPFVTLDKGTTALDLLNATGYEFMAAGNHDFNYGYERLLELFKNSKYKQLNILAANIKKDNNFLFEQNKIKEMTVNGKAVKIGFFGLTT